MSMRTTAIGRILVASLCGIALLPAVSAAQECSNCKKCPYDPTQIFLQDDGGEVAWLYPQCEHINCEELIGCPGDDDVDLDALASAIDNKTWTVVEGVIDATGKVSFNEGRNALVVSGCRAGSIAAILPLPKDPTIAMRLSERARLASLRRAVAAAALVPGAF